MADVHPHIREPGGLQATSEGVRVDEHHGVTDVSEAEQGRRRAVGASEKGSMLQDPRHLAEKSVLQLRRGDVCSIVKQAAPVNR